MTVAATMSSKFFHTKNQFRKFFLYPRRGNDIIRFRGGHEPPDRPVGGLRVVLRGGEGQLLHQPHEHHEQLRLGQRLAKADTFA